MRSRNIEWAKFRSSVTFTQQYTKFAPTNRKRAVARATGASLLPESVACDEIEQQDLGSPLQPDIQGFESPRLQTKQRKSIDFKKMQLSERALFLMKLVTNTQGCW
jgi:predicted NAD-dependent protein-ADP-ribosyltransferase YbiA (DUF1768 family)